MISELALNQRKEIYLGITESLISEARLGKLHCSDRTLNYANLEDDAQ